MSKEWKQPECFKCKDPIRFKKGEKTIYNMDWTLHDHSKPNNGRATAEQVNEDLKQKVVETQKKSPTNAQGIIEEQLNMRIEIDDLKEFKKTMLIWKEEISKAVANISNFRASDLKASQED